MGCFKPQKSRGGVSRSSSLWLLESCCSQKLGQGTQPAPPVGHTGQRGGQVPSGAAPRIRGAAQQRDPDPELSPGCLHPDGDRRGVPCSSGLSPSRRKGHLPARHLQGGQHRGGQPRLLPPPGRCRERTQAAARGRKGSAALHTKIPLLLTPLSVALACPQPTWAPGCLAVPDPVPAAGGMAKAALGWLQRSLVPSATGSRAGGLPHPCSGLPPAPSGLQVVGEPQQLFLAVDGFQVL